MADIEIFPFNEIYVKVQCEAGIDYEMVEHFSFRVQGYQHQPKYKAGVWDGYIRLYSRHTYKIYKGLLKRILEFAKDRGYSVDIDPELLKDVRVVFTAEDLDAFIETLNLPEDRKPFDYQRQYILECIQKKRRLCISPTSSGKSLIVYILLRYLLEYQDQNILILVDSINLRNQMFSDFKDYGFNSEANLHLMKGSKERFTQKRIIVCTWLTGSKQPPEWISQFGAIMLDEAHRAQATSVKKVFEAAPKTAYRLGFTGTLDGTMTHQMVLEGLMGPKIEFIRTKDLQDRGISAKIKIICLVINYPEEECRAVSKLRYDEEQAFIFAHGKRNGLIKKLALDFKGNNVVMFKHIDHGKKLFDAISSEAKVPCFYFAGEVKGEDREEIRQTIMGHEESCTVASSGTFATGTNIPNINNMFNAAPFKSQIRVLQTIGRGLRVTKDKDTFYFVDIVDNFSWKKRKNFTYRHFLERLKIYNEQEFPYEIREIDWSKT